VTSFEVVLFLTPRRIIRRWRFRKKRFEDAVDLGLVHGISSALTKNDPPVLV
jgi:hypothetical protein